MTEKPPVNAMDAFEHYLFESGLDEPHVTRMLKFADAIEREAAAATSLDVRCGCPRCAEHDAVYARLDEGSDR